MTPARETWKCFGCGRGGDIFNFVMERDSIDFPEALRRLAGRAGVEISERTTREDARRKRLRDALDAAIAFYHRILTESRHGQPALDYLHGRGFTDETIATHQLGYAVDAWDTLSRALIAKRDFREEELEAVGPRHQAPGTARRLRPLPGPNHLPDPRRIGQRDRTRRPHRGQREAARGRPRPGSQVPQLAGDAAVRQEPHAVPDRPRQVGHPQERRGRPRRGQHGCADGASAGLRQRGRHARHGADAGPGRARDALCAAHRAGV